jgi:preprotein translocase subunit SecB
LVQFSAVASHWPRLGLNVQRPALFTGGACVSQPLTPIGGPEINNMSEGNGGPQPQAMPQIGVLGQYVKDLSFENPNAPRSITPTGQQPSINIQVNVDATPISAIDFEVTLRLEGKAEAQGMLLFNFELVFAGAFRIQNVPAETLQPIVLIECPRLLFPFAREIIATAVRNGGFAPLLLDPIDFVGLYRQRVAAGPTVPTQPANSN